MQPTNTLHQPDQDCFNYLLARQLFLKAAKLLPSAIAVSQVHLEKPVLGEKQANTNDTGQPPKCILNVPVRLHHFSALMLMSVSSKPGKQCHKGKTQSYSV